MGDLPLSPYVYEIGNSLISSLAICLTLILAWFFATEVYNLGIAAAHARMRFKLGLALAAIIVGGGAYRMWTWWGRYCANIDSDCAWMLTKTWPFVPIYSNALELVGMLCLIRILIPDVWGTRAWIISACLSLTWSLWWFSGWPAVIATVAGFF